MADERINKGVTFYLDDPDHMELLAHASERKNFAEYVRQLIRLDIEGELLSRRLSSLVAQIGTLPVSPEEKPKLDIKQLNSFL